MDSLGTTQHVLVLMYRASSCEHRARIPYIYECVKERALCAGRCLREWVSVSEALSSELLYVWCVPRSKAMAAVRGTDRKWTGDYCLQAERPTALHRYDYGPTANHLNEVYLYL